MTFLSSTCLRLRAIEPEDLSLIYRWENEAAVWGDGCVLAPYSRYAVRVYIEESLKQDIFQMRQMRLMMVSQKSGEEVGMIDLYDFDPHHQRAAVGVYVDIPYRRQGFGSEALTLLCRYAFDFLHLHQLYAQVAERNVASLRLFEQVGFERCGLLKEWIRLEKGFGNIIEWQRCNPNNE
ncbi:MAG: GNAT family N-acetyltransferase [Porphyromonadaceae bacterium]|nr:GNAT family N-acetyltransferase [Porphyromonadaceae bacterium]